MAKRKCNPRTSKGRTGVAGFYAHHFYACRHCDVALISSPSPYDNNFLDFFRPPLISIVADLGFWRKAGDCRWCHLAACLCLLLYLRCILTFCFLSPIGWNLKWDSWPPVSVATEEMQSAMVQFDSPHVFLLAQRWYIWYISYGFSHRARRPVSSSSSFVTKWGSRISRKRFDLEWPIFTLTFTPVGFTTPDITSLYASGRKLSTFEKGSKMIHPTAST